jgi:hypothetical protein
MVRLRRLIVPREATKLTVAAAHYRSEVRPLAADLRTLGVISMRLLPAITGTVSNREMPIAGARVSAPGIAETDTDALGRFRLEVQDAWPELVKVDAQGYAPKHLPLTTTETDLDLGRIVMERGGRIRVISARVAEIDSAVLLLRRDEKAVTVANATHIDGALEFSAVEAGSYFLVVKGKGPLQRSVKPVDVTDGTTTDVELALSRIRLTVSVTADRRPVSAEVRIEPLSGEWESSFVTGAEGRVTHELWQDGEFAATVSSGVDDGFIAHEAIHANEQEEAHWDIELPTKRVVGLVVGSDGRPLEGARVVLETTLGDGSIRAVEASDAAGAFRFSSVFAGDQSLTVSLAGHAKETRTFVIGESEPEHRLTVQLHRALVRTVRVVDSAGRAVANALLAEAPGAGTERISDGAGEATVELREGERKTLYVFPPGGSFAVVQVEAEQNQNGGSAPVIATVPPGPASLRVVARAGGEPVVGVFFALRHDGVMIPVGVRFSMLNRRGIPVQTGHDGTAVMTSVPLGVYEVWPYFSRAEALRIEAGTVEPAARIAVQPGLNVVTFTFDKSEP